MDLTIPFATFDPSKIRVGQLTKTAKPLLPISYQDGEQPFYNVTLMLPVLSLRSYDPVTGRMALTLPASAVTKFQSFQESLLSTVMSHQKEWFPGDPVLTKEELREGFQPIMDHGALHLYCPTQPANEIPTFYQGAWLSKGRFPNLATGAQLRIVVKLQGVSFHKHPVSGAWTGKFRLQHRIQGILIGSKG